MENGKEYTNKHQGTQSKLSFISLNVYMQQMKKVNSRYPLFKYFTLIIYSFPNPVVKHVHIALISFFLYFIIHSKIHLSSSWLSGRCLSGSPTIRIGLEVRVNIFVL
jgi:hypothetical protein